MAELNPTHYMKYVIYHAIAEARTKEEEYASNNVRVSVSLSLGELGYLYLCIKEHEGGDADADE